HPLAWLGARQLRSAREQACDDAVLRRGIAPPDYAGRLLDLALTVASRPRTWTQAPAMADMSDLETRVRALLDRGRNRQPLGRRAAAAVAAGGLAVLLAAAAITARAQAGNASLTGAVWDPSGAVIPGCEVAIKRADGSHQEVTRADGAGEFKFASVPPGSYGVEIRAPGFVTFKKDVKLAPAAAARLDAELVMGQVTETIVVTAPRLAPPLPAPRTPRRIRVGGNVQATRLIYHVKPVYPADSQQRGVEGAVVLRAVISIQGELLNLTPMSSEVDPELSRAALDAVRQWRYSPTLLNGQPVEVLTTIRVTFQLE
ncbi:MAG: TonB family protein, partial [Acidobacteriia bacterium]|nr:TonB family protein [Terriglobia bacterium]